ncbi:MAG: penicillin acylase family protein [Proteobacteria bacterium]|nr:penicillin acylase family protein [Pseudomonadota bacterium]
MLLRILRRLLLTLIVLLVFIVIGVWLMVRASLPQLDGHVATARFSASIERDAVGTTTIHGPDRVSVSYALGYVHGQERFFAMDLMRRAAAGELSEIVGKATLKMDKQRRAFRMRARAEQLLATLPAEQHADVLAYRDGVNDGLAALTSRPWEYWLLGTTPKPWSEADCILVLDAMFFDLNDSTNARELALAKMKAALPDSVFHFLHDGAGPWDAPLTGASPPLPALPPQSDIDLRKVDAKLLRSAMRDTARESIEPLPTTASAPDFSSALAALSIGTDAAAPRILSALRSGTDTDVVGSNNFAVGGSLTATGAAMVANDMHLGLRVPNIWFRARLQYPNPRHAGENVDLIGVTLPGIPALVAGSNRHIAWAFTNSYGDWLDWVRVVADPGDKNRYLTADGAQPIATHDEVIAVHGAADEHLSVRDTQWGPILADDVDGTPLALAWTALQAGGINIDLLKLDTAETVDEGFVIANSAGMPAQNFVVGDRHGDIGWTIAGRIPRRGNCDAQLPCDWSVAGNGWNGWLDPAEYPHVKNPSNARLWTANSRTLDLASPDYARVGDGGFDLGARQQQIRDDLLAKSQLAPADFLAIQLDDRALFLKPWHERLRDTLAHADAPELADMKKYTEDWNERADPDSVGYRLARAFRIEVVDTVLDGFAAAVRAKFSGFAFPAHLQGEHQVEAILAARPPYLLPPGYADWDDLLRQCAQRVAAKFAARPGGLAARTWGEVTATHIDHPLSAAVPLLGKFIDMPSERLPGDANMPRVQGAAFGASERFGVQPGHEENGYFHMPGGQSGNPLSPFYGAGHEDWAQGKPTPFLPGETKYRLTLRQ